jgi:hypothetical protein
MTIHIFGTIEHSMYVRTSSGAMSVKSSSRFCYAEGSGCAYGRHFFFSRGSRVERMERGGRAWRFGFPHLHLVNPSKP